MVEVHKVTQLVNDDAFDADIRRAYEVLIERDKSAGAAETPATAHLSHGKARVSKGRHTKLGQKLVDHLAKMRFGLASLPASQPFRGIRFGHIGGQDNICVVPAPCQQIASQVYLPWRRSLGYHAFAGASLGKLADDPLLMVVDEEVDCLDAHRERGFDDDGGRRFDLDHYGAPSTADQAIRDLLRDR